MKNDRLGIEIALLKKTVQGIYFLDLLLWIDGFRCCLGYSTLDGYCLYIQSVAVIIAMHLDMRLSLDHSNAIHPVASPAIVRGAFFAISPSCTIPLL